MGCEKYKLDQAIDFCETVRMGAVDAILINDSDIEGYKPAATETNVFSGVALKTGTMGYKVFDAKKRPFMGSEFTHEEDEIADRTLKSVSFVVMDQGAAGADVVQKLQGGGYVMIMRNRDGNFEIIGKDSPLYLTDKTKNVVEGSGGWTVTMQASETGVGNFFFDIDEATTLASYEALLIAAI